MTDIIPCKKCGVLILPATSERNGGVCMPCKNGTRKSIEESREYYKKERERDKTCPYRRYWKELVDKVYDDSLGFESLCESEKVYFAMNCLIGEVYNGGFMQYFDNSSGEHYYWAEKGLIEVSANKSLDLLRKAKNELFRDAEVPNDREERLKASENKSAQIALDMLDDEFYKDIDKLDDRLESYAIDRGLVKID